MDTSAQAEAPTEATAEKTAAGILDVLQGCSTQSSAKFAGKTYADLVKTGS